MPPTKTCVILRAAKTIAAEHTFLNAKCMERECAQWNEGAQMCGLICPIGSELPMVILSSPGDGENGWEQCSITG